MRKNIVVIAYEQGTGYGKKDQVGVSVLPLYTQKTPLREEHISGDWW
jgi:hypothetical protein